MTVAQHDCGVLGTWCKAEGEQVPAPLARLVRNIFVFSAGGYGHVPIPLIRSSMPVEAPGAPKDRRYWVSFAGTVGHAPRMFRENLSKCVNSINHQSSPACRGLEPPSRPAPSHQHPFRCTLGAIAELERPCAGNLALDSVSSCPHAFLIVARSVDLCRCTF